MLTIALYVILSTLQSQTPSGLQKQGKSSLPLGIPLYFCQDFFFSFGGKPLQISIALPGRLFYTCVFFALQTCLDFPAALPVIYVAQGWQRVQRSITLDFNVLHMLIITPVVSEHEQRLTNNLFLM